MFADNSARDLEDGVTVDSAVHSKHHSIARAASRELHFLRVDTYIAPSAAGIDTGSNLVPHFGGFFAVALPLPRTGDLYGAILRRDQVVIKIWKRFT